MEIKGKVIELEIDVLIKGQSGTYSGSKLVYKDGNGKVQEKAFHENTFKYNAAFKDELTGLKAGDMFTAIAEKNGAYWNWVSISKDKPEVATSAAKPATTSGGNWETPEERKNKQLYIIRQSSITAAIKMLEMNGMKKIATNEVTKIADELVFWIYNGNILETPNDNIE